MNNETFYVAAVTVIPLLLIAVMATRSLRVGEFSSQPRITMMIFGLPVLGELAAFAFLFFEPVPAAAAVIIALVTWAGLLSQLGVATWWCAELIRHPEGQQAGPADGDPPEVGTRSRRLVCPSCAEPLPEGTRFCGNCGTAVREAGADTLEGTGAALRDHDDLAPHTPLPPAPRKDSVPPEKDGGGSSGVVGVEPTRETRTPGVRQLLSRAAESRCPMCGATRPAGTLFCPFCGRPG